MRKINIPEGSDLQKAADELQAAALKYRAAYDKAFFPAPAVIWLECQAHGFTLVFTGGEYQERLEQFFNDLERWPR